MGSFIEEILKSATAGKADSGVLGSVIEAAKEKMGDKSLGGLGDIIGQVTGKQGPATKGITKDEAQEEAATETGGLGDIIGQLGLGGGKPDLGNIGDIAKSVINVIGLAQGALGGKK